MTKPYSVNGLWPGLCHHLNSVDLFCDGRPSRSRATLGRSKSVSRGQCSDGRRTEGSIQGAVTRGDCTQKLSRAKQFTPAQRTDGRTHFFSPWTLILRLKIESRLKNVRLSAFRRHK
ncbi:hypothetical protein TNCT_729341 [Trichonephila clavata]|uniref:Uncharacterized protein n=1 Tax=Trichonephila clavata TaxID=2740835 RepID=A0A8X6LTP0_TRICU|nr:hypothetical protein TNCT_729341 [Trichonephila clavata]